MHGKTFSKNIKSKIDLSVIIPIYNGDKHLRDMFDSIVRQKEPPAFEVIVVDNGSTDNSKFIARKYKKYLNIVIIDSIKNNNKNSAINTGVSVSIGKKILFLDQDDMVSETYIKEMSEALGHSKFIASSMDANKLSCWSYPPRFAPMNQKIGEFFWRIASGGTLGIIREIFIDVGGFREDFNYSTGDAEFCCRVQKAGYKLDLVNNAILYYRFRESLKGNYLQGIYYGLGNYELEKLYPGIRGNRMTFGKIISEIISQTYLLIRPSQKNNRAMLVHGIGKNIGYLKGIISDW